MIKALLRSKSQRPLVKCFYFAFFNATQNVISLSTEDGIAMQSVLSAGSDNVPKKHLCAVVEI